MAWLADWKYRREITIDHNDVDATLTQFPILVYLSSSSGIGDDDVTSIFDEIGANRKKIAITQSDGTTQLYVEIDKWDNGNEKAWLWISKSGWEISDSVDTKIYIYYDNAKADNVAFVGDTNSAQAEAVWDSGFKFVSHMRDDPDTSHIRDSTDNNNDGTKKAANEPQVITDGKIDDAQDFAGDDDYITLPFGLTPPYTIEFWAKPDNVTGSAAILAFERTDPTYSGVAMGFYNGSDEILIGNHSFSKGLDGVDTYLTNGVWAHWVDVVNAADDIDFYLDGTEKILDNTTHWTQDQSNKRYIGCRETGGGRSQFFNGKVDEVRISNEARSSAWVKSTYETGRDDFVTYGSEEELPTATGSAIYYNDGTTNIELQRDDSSPVQMFNGVEIVGLKLGATDDPNATPIHIYTTSIKAILKMP